MRPQLLDVDDAHADVGEELLEDEQREVGEVLVVDGVELVLRDQAEQVRHLDRDGPLGLEQDAEALGEVAEARHVREHVVGGDQIGRDAPGPQRPRRVRPEEGDLGGHALLDGDLGDVLGRLDAEDRYAVGLEVLQEIAVVAGNLHHLGRRGQPEPRHHAVGVLPAVLQPGVGERREVGVVAEDVLGALELVELHEQAAITDVDVQRVERFLLVQVFGANERVRQRREAEIDERAGDGLAAQAARARGHEAAFLPSDSKRAICSRVSAAASSPACCRRYQSTVQRTPCSRRSRGVQPSLARAFEASTWSRAASWGCSPASCSQRALAAPELDQPIDHPGHRLGVVHRRSEVPGFGKAGRALGQPLREQQVARERLEHVLPGPDRGGTPDHHRRAGGEGPHAVGHEAILGPVAAADHVAGPGRGHAGRRGRAAEVGSPPRRGHELRAALAAAVGIVAAEGVVFAVGPPPLTVLVALVARHDDDGAKRLGMARGFEHVRRAHDVGLIGGDGVGVGAADERLSGEVEDDLGARLRDDGVHDGAGPDVAEARIDAPGEAGEREQARVTSRAPAQGR